MSLDPPMTDAQVRAMLERKGGVVEAPLSDDALRARAGVGRINGIVPGPQSPLLDDRTPVPHKARGTGRKRRQEEEAMQARLFEKLNDLGEQMKRPELALAFHPANGGSRRPAVAAKFKAQGVKPGVLDVWLPVARGGFYGLIVELKTPTGSLTPEQVHWLSAMERQGWKVTVHESDVTAWAECLHYLDAPHPSRR